MKKYLYMLPILLGLAALPLAAQEQKGNEKKTNIDLEKDITKISRALGHIIGQQLKSSGIEVEMYHITISVQMSLKELESLGVEFEMDEVIIGAQESLKGIASPMTEQEFSQAISMAQEGAVQKH